MFFPSLFLLDEIYIDRKLCWSSVLVKWFSREKGLFLIHGKDLFELPGYGLLEYHPILIFIIPCVLNPKLQLDFVKSLLLSQGEEGLVHFQWLDRTQNVVEDVSFVFPPQFCTLGHHHLSDARLCAFFSGAVVQLFCTISFLDWYSLQVNTFWFLCESDSSIL